MEELFKELNSLYKDYLLTEDKEHITYLCKIVKQYSPERHITYYTTSNINIEYFPKNIRKKIKLVKINGIGFPLNCYANSKIFQNAKTKEVKRVLGLNLFACPCGSRIITEPHAINEIEGVLYDFTKDTKNESHKYFISFDDIVCEYEINKYAFEINYKKCNCKLNTKTSIENKINMDEFVKIYYDI